jgi:DNA-binding MarR family transcriptional regulator
MSSRRLSKPAPRGRKAEALPDVGVRNPRTLAQFTAYASLLRAAESLQRGFAELLKAVDLSPSQYNILRVLRVAGPLGMTCGQVGGQLIRHDPDVTRLMDRLERRALIARSREPEDRRVVRTRITASGLDLIAGLDAPVNALHEQQFGHMSERQLDELSALLATAQTHAP